MRKFKLTICLIFLYTGIFAQPTNDNCSNPITLTVGSSCNFTTYTTLNATQSGVTAPTCGGTALNDVWFSAVVPLSGKLIINTDTGSITNGAMALYSGTCNSLTLIECDDDDSYNGLMPSITRTDLTPGETVYIRFWKKTTGAGGTFKLCVYDFGPACASGNPSPSDNCVDAPFICNLDGFCGVTYPSPTYTVDNPGFSSSCGFSLDNNSWLKFIASSTSVSLNVWTYGCTINYGIQIGFFEGDCTNGFASVACANNNTTANNTSVPFNINGLTIGQTYYIMIDGYAGDVCNYTIKANYGVLTIDAGADTTVCDGATFARTATGVPGITYNWYSDAALSNLITSGATVNITASSAQSPKKYYLEALGNPSCPTTAIDSFTVITNPIPNATASANSNSICAGNSANLTSSGGSSYSWSSLPSGLISNLQNPTVSPTINTTYTVTVSNGSCSDTEKVIISILPTPTVEAGINQTICAGSSANITATGTAGNTYAWNNSLNTANITVNPTTNSVYTVIASNNGCSASDNITINVNALPLAEAGSNQTVCGGAGTILTATGGTTFEWNTSETTSSITVNPVIPTTYTVTVTNNGCSATDNVEVSIAPALNVNLGSNYSVCKVQNILIDAGVAGLNYLWAPNGETTQSIQANNPGTYKLTVTNSSGCTGMAQITINEYPSVVATITPAGPANICIGSSISLSVSGGTSLLWSTGASSNPVVVSPSANTTYTATVTDGNGCSGSSSVSVNIIPLPVFNLGNDTVICQGQQVTLVANIAGNSYNWSTGDNSTFINVNTSGNYYVDVNTNCGIVSDTMRVTVNPIPVVNLGRDTALCIEKFVLSAKDIYYSYLWSTGANTSQISVNTEGTYSVTVSDINGCSNSDIIKITDSCEIDIYIPNVFTPQGDGLNDKFYAVTKNVDEIEFYIYNRWGELVYKTKNINDSWDGKTNGIDCQQGVYFYILNYRRKSASFNSMSGSITLLR